MTDITVSRELLRQVLDALTCTGDDDDPGHRCGWCDDYVDRNGPVRKALRAALEQPAVEQAEKLDPLTQLQVAYVMGLRDANSAPQPAPVQEQQPVAWGITCNGQFTGNLFGYREAAEVVMIELNRKYPTDKRTIEPLFAAQPRKAVKLSEEVMLDVCRKQTNIRYVEYNTDALLRMSRAIEQAVLKANGVTE